MKTIASILLALLATSAACGDATETGPNDERADDGSADAVPVLAEQYGAVVSSTMKICKVAESPCPAAEAIEVTATLRGLMRVEQDEASVVGNLTACNIKLNWNGDEYDSDEYLNIETLGQLLRFSGGFASTEEGPRLRSGLAALLIGAELSDDVGEDFPTDDKDARAIDQDNDGDPGISVKAPIGRVFMGARAVLDFELELEGNEAGTLLGTATGYGFDVSVYDDTVPFVNVEKKLRNALDPISLVEQNHGVELHPGTADCEAAKAL
jgi:hypothetical protein